MTTQEESLSLETETKEILTNADERHKKSFNDMSVVIEKLEEELKNIKEEYQATEQSLMKKKMKGLLECQGWVQRYDTDLFAKQQELDDLEKIYDTELQELRELEEHFEKVDAETKLIEEEEAAWESKLMEEEEAEMVFHRAAAG